MGTKDRIQPLKLEDPSTGGVETDYGPTSADPNEDYVDTHGVTIQSNISDDEDVYIGRDVSDDMVFQDKVAGGPYTLADLLGDLSKEEHKTLRQLIHFIDNGPAEGFASGAYRETTGTVFPTAIVWWESSSKLKKIVEKLITWTGPVPSTIAWKVYDSGGNLVATVSDSITYSGVYETSRTRTITVE